MTSVDQSISSRDFTRLRELIYGQAGICLGPEKKTMLEARVKRRLKALELNSYTEYCDYLFGRQGLKEEIVHLIDVVTTNKTDFFREPKHFDFLVSKCASRVCRALRKRQAVSDLECRLLDRRRAVHAGHRAQRVSRSLIPAFASACWPPTSRPRCWPRLSSASIPLKQPKPVPNPRSGRNIFCAAAITDSNRVRVVPELRRLVEFRRLNFMDSDYGLSGEGRRRLLPQRHHLLRPADAGEHS